MIINVIYTFSNLDTNKLKVQKTIKFLHYLLNDKLSIFLIL